MTSHTHTHTNTHTHTHKHTHTHTHTQTHTHTHFLSPMPKICPQTQSRSAVENPSIPTLTRRIINIHNRIAQIVPLAHHIQLLRRYFGPSNLHINHIRYPRHQTHCIQRGARQQRDIALVMPPRAHARCTPARKP